MLTWNVAGMKIGELRDLIQHLSGRDWGVLCLQELSNNGKLDNVKLETGHEIYFATAMGFRKRSAVVVHRKWTQ
eukprot:11562543-Karenia_brevis.AAC.1